MVKLTDSDVRFLETLSDAIGKRPNAIQAMMPKAWDTIQEIQGSLEKARALMGSELFGSTLEDLLSAAVNSPEGNYSAPLSRIKKLYEKLNSYYGDLNSLLDLVGLIEMVTDPQNLADSGVKRFKSYELQNIDDPQISYKKRRNRH